MVLPEGGLRVKLAQNNAEAGGRREAVLRKPTDGQVAIHNGLSTFERRLLFARFGRSASATRKAAIILIEGDKTEIRML